MRHISSGAVHIDRPCSAYSGKTTRSSAGVVAARLADHRDDPVGLRRELRRRLDDRQLQLHQADDDAVRRFVETSETAHARCFLDAMHRRQLARAAARDAARPAADDEDHQRQHVGHRGEQVVALADADRLQRRADRAGAAEEQRRADAAQRAPAREDHQRDRDQALAARDAFVPAARIEQRQRGAAEPGDGAAGGGRRDADAVDRIAERPRRARRVAGHAHQQAPARAREAPAQQRARARCRAAAAG